MFLRLLFSLFFFFFFNDTATTEIYTLSLHDALPICDGPHVARQTVGELAGEPLGGRAAVGEIAALQLRTRGELSRARAAAGVAERRVDDDAAPAGLAHGERQVAIVAVEEPVALGDPAHRLERRAAQAEADAIDDCDLLPRRAHEIGR